MNIDTVTAGSDTEVGVERTLTSFGQGATFYNKRSPLPVLLVSSKALNWSLSTGPCVFRVFYEHSSVPLTSVVDLHILSTTRD